MKQVIAVITILAGFSLAAIAQTRPSSRYHFVDLTGTIGAKQGSGAASYVHNWRIGRKRNIEAGIGVRWTTYFGTKKDFLTAGPAKKNQDLYCPIPDIFCRPGRAEL